MIQERLLTGCSFRSSPFKSYWIAILESFLKRPARPVVHFYCLEFRKILFRSRNLRGFRRFDRSNNLRLYSGLSLLLRLLFNCFTDLFNVLRILFGCYYDEKKAWTCKRRGRIPCDLFRYRLRYRLRYWYRVCRRVSGTAIRVSGTTVRVSGTTVRVGRTTVRVGRTTIRVGRATVRIS